MRMPLECANSACGWCIAFCLLALAACAPARENVGDAAPAGAVDPRCAALVERMREDPRSEVDTPPMTTRIMIGSGPQLREAVTVTFVVTEHGRVDASTIEIEGSAPLAARRELRQQARQWEFRPARLEGCAVPALYTYTHGPAR